jgi:D-beta-D-heptose 7-phosphate kinase/D-beta-D-heptose 1-phosphate adenosyltransferase
VFNRITNKNVNILVLGDLILDRYIEGHVKRISPEAPVPVLLQTSDRDVLGGAGNVANNIKALGGEALLIGVTGRDDAAERIKTCAAQSGVNLIPIIDDNRRTTVKTRLLGDRQQLLRVDNEDLSDIAKNTEKKLFEALNEAIPQVDAIIISDYRKGTLTELILRQAIENAKKHNIPVFIDPKGSKYNNYIGADYIKPNRSELEILTNVQCGDMESISRAAGLLSEQTGANILVTLSQEGMIFFKRDGSKFTLPTQAKEVFDVSGAGDTAIASFAFALSHGETAETAVRFANISSGIAVSKVGTAAVSLQEILSVAGQLFAHDISRMNEQVDLNHAAKIREDWKRQGLKVGFTNGCFDLLHPGHIALLRGASAECDRLIVGLNSDSSVRRLKGSQRPIQTEQARAEVLGAIECVDLVVIFNEDTPLEAIKFIKPDVLIKGSDYEEKDIVGADFVKASGGQVARIQIREGHSTTNLVNRSNNS